MVSHIVQKSRSALGERSRILETKDGTWSSVNLHRQTRRERVYCCFLCIRASDEQKQSVTRGIGHSQSDRHNRGGCGLRERFGHVRHSEVTATVLFLEKLCEEHGLFIQVERRPTCKSHRDWQGHSLQIQ